MRAGIVFEPEPPVSPAPQSRRQALTRLRDRLLLAGIAAAEPEAEWLLLHALGIGRAAYWSDPTAILRPDEAVALEALAERRERRVPLQLLLGDVPFHGVTLSVTPGVFLPRPETEVLVEAVLAALAAGGPSTPGNDVARGGTLLGGTLLGGTLRGGTLLDWGTGTGAIALSLLNALPAWTAVGTDRSKPALALAARNAERNGVAGRFRAIEADFGAPGGRSLPGQPFDVVVSNPPYVRRGDLPGLMPEVRDHDPREALDGGDDGLDALRHLARGLDRWLRFGGLLALEIGADQTDDVLGLFEGLIQDTRVLPDRAGMPRIVIGTMRGGGA